MELRIRQLHSLFYPHFSSDFFCFYTVSSAFSAFSTAAADSASAAASSVPVSSPGRTRCASTIGSMVCAISRWIMSRLRSRNRDGRSGAIATSVTRDSRPSIIRSLPGVSSHSSLIRSKSRWKMILTLRLWPLPEMQTQASAPVRRLHSPQTVPSFRADTIPRFPPILQLWTP